MKSVVYTLGLLLATFLCRSATAQINMPSKTVRQDIPYPVAKLEILGKSAVKIFYDTINYIEVIYNPAESDPINDNTIVMNGMTLTINDPSGKMAYMLHLKKEELLSIKQDAKTLVVYSDTKGAAAGDTDADSLRNNWNSLSDELAAAEEELLTAEDEFRDTFGLNNKNEQDKPHYSYSDRAGFDFLWGFTNWGDKWYNGLSKMDGAYNLRTTFSSYQLELKYALMMTQHWKFSLGIGYESDVYKFSNPLVDMSIWGTLYNRMDDISYADFRATNDQFANTHLNDWSTRLVTRYVTMPLSVGYRFEKFRINVTALPALAINSRHTGLKHEIDTRDVEHQDVEDVSRFLAPYKLDIRLDIRFNLFGLFLQVPTSTLFTPGSPTISEVYPIKLGFVIL